MLNKLKKPLKNEKINCLLLELIIKVLKNAKNSTKSFNNFNFSSIRKLFKHFTKTTPKKLLIKIFILDLGFRFIMINPKIGSSIIVEYKKTASIANLVHKIIIK